MLFRHLVALALLACPLAAAAADEALWQLQLRSSRHSDFGSIGDLRSDDASRHRARGSRNLAYVDEEVRVQRSAGAWSFALLARSTATLYASRDAVDLLRHAQDIGRDATDRQWDVDARLRGFTGGGLEAARGFELAPGWSARGLVQALVLTRWRDRHIAGAAGFRAATATYGFGLQSTEINDRLKFPFQVAHDPRGAGLLFGADLRWEPGDWVLGLSARDLGWLYWKGVPQQEFTLSSDTRAVDEDGFVVFRPLLQGQNSQRGLARTAPARWSGFVQWKAPRDGRLTVAAEYVKDFGLLPSASWSQPLGPLQAEVAWRFHERRLELGLGWGGLRVRLGADRLGSPGDMHSRTVAVSYSRAF